MAKLRRNLEWNGALRRLVEERDRLLPALTELSPRRRKILGAALTQEFPVEAILQTVATRRDELLPEPLREDPPSVTNDLRRCLTSARSLAEVSREFSQRVALLAACLIAGLGIVFLGKSGPAFGPKRKALATQAAMNQQLTTAQKLSLRMSAAEMASLRSTFLASTTAEEPPGASARLRLDLPVRAFLRDDAIASTP
ncbi:MAG: hypothetical protein ACR2MW_03960 [Chthoniobacterales bacterium]